MYKILSGDLPPAPPDIEAGDRPTAVHMLPTLIASEALKGGVAIVIDALRASVTITQALASGCQRVHPVLTVSEAMAKANSLRAAGHRVIVGGERAGERPTGFDLGNSPSAYTPGAVGGADMVFSTTNGTATLLHARLASRVIVASLSNLGAVCEAVAAVDAPLHIICAGTREEVSMEDVLVAGLIAQRVVARGRTLVADDSARVAMALAASASTPDAVLSAFRASRGGRNLRRLGLDDDIAFCSRADTLAVVPVFDAARGVIRPA